MLVPLFSYFPIKPERSLFLLICLHLKEIHKVQVIEFLGFCFYCFGTLSSLGKAIESSQENLILNLSSHESKKFIDPLQPSIAFYIETNYFISSINQMAGF